MPLRKLLNNNVKVGFGSDISGGHSFSIFKTIVYAVDIYSNVFYLFLNHNSNQPIIFLYIF